MSTTINDIGSMRWELVACAAVVWVVVYFCIWKGVKSAGKVSFIILRQTSIPELIEQSLLVAVKLHIHICLPEA